MSGNSDHEKEIETIWRTYLTTGEYKKERRQRAFFRLLPGTRRCKNCYAPFQGLGATVVRTLYGKKPSSFNPLMCNVCDIFAQEYQGGAEIELSLLFADVRGSTTIAEQMSPTEFSKLINRFYNTATHVMVHTDALIDKIIGDQVSGMYVPGFTGPEHAQVAITAAQDILRETGHGRESDPWIPLGVGVHTGVAFVGAVGSKDGTYDITVLGDVPNTAARLSSSAAVGEILISDSAVSASRIETGSMEERTLELKGKTEPFTVYVMTNP